MNLSDYKALVFDCDGVVLDSNRIKTDAFRLAAQPYGSAAAEALVAYHVANGGISRYAKFAYFLEELVPQHAPGIEGPGIDELLASFADCVRAGLETCQVAEELENLRATTENARWLIVSGGDQSELRSIFKTRGLAELFDGGIFGSPDTKQDILNREIDSGSIENPALFLGDSKLDHLAASACNLDFLFVSKWTEFSDWQTYCARHHLSSISEIAQLLPAVAKQASGRHRPG